MIPQSFIEDLRFAANAESIIGSYVDLKRAGRNLSGLCPFHSEKTPSFTVYPESNSFYCFGCGAGGDIITFIRRIENLEYVEAVKFLAEKLGMSLPEDAIDDHTASLKTKVLEINRESARFFHQTLLSEEGAGARKYLAMRALTSSTIRHFGIGYAPNRWESLCNHLHSKGFKDEDMIAAAVARRGKNGNVYDIFRDRVIFPIIDLRGNVIAFGGRKMEGEGPKYYNSTDTPVFKKTKNLFALNFAKAKNLSHIILCEGYMDVVTMHQAGFTEAVASLGTALTEDQARLISSYTGEVILSYDSDAPGQKATKRAISLLENAGVNTRVLTIDGAKDPDEYIKKFGKERFAKCLEGSFGSMEYQLSAIKAKYPTDTENGRLMVLREAASLLASLPGKLERDVWAGKLATDYGVNKDALLAQINRQIKKNIATKEKKEASRLALPSTENAGVLPEKRKYPRAVTGEEGLITALFRHPNKCLYAAESLSPEDFVSDYLRRVFEVQVSAAKNGNEPATKLFGEEFTMDEQALSSRLMAKARDISCDDCEVEDMIGVIKDEKAKRERGDIKDMTGEDLSKYLSEIRKKKL